METTSKKNPYIIPTPRLEVESLSPYSAPLEGRREFLRLDFNENTIGPSPLVTKALQNISNNQIAIYPEYDGLKELFSQSLNKKSKSLKIESSQIGVFNGVDAAIHAIFHAFGDKGEQLLTTDPTFGYYAPCAQMQGMKINQIPYEGKNFKFPLGKINTSLEKEKPKLLLICNPNNPTGTRLKAKEILKMSKISPKTLIVIDELYEAFTGDSVLPVINLNKIPNILVLRSLSKTAGLAGLRIGFAIGHPQVIERINRVTGPYDVNSFAVTASFAALKDQEYIEAYVKKVLQAKEWLNNQLIKYKVNHHIGGGNYLLIWPNSSAFHIQNYLKKQGILVRNMSKKNLIEGSLRVSIGTLDQMQLFWNNFKIGDNLKIN